MLLKRAFVHRSDVPAWGHGLDHWTVGIPNYYAWAYYGLAQAAAQRDDGERLETFRVKADLWAELGST